MLQLLSVGVDSRRNRHHSIASDIGSDIHPGGEQSAAVHGACPPDGARTSSSDDRLDIDMPACIGNESGAREDVLAEGRDRTGDQAARHLLEDAVVDQTGVEVVPFRRRPCRVAAPLDNAMHGRARLGDLPDDIGDGGKIGVHPLQARVVSTSDGTDVVRETFNPAMPGIPPLPSVVVDVPML